MSSEGNNSSPCSDKPVFVKIFCYAFSWLLLGLIQFYRRFISPFTRSSCRFYPTCSQYALESVKKHGPLKGGLYAIKRILKCHPLNPGGYDPVP